MWRREIEHISPLPHQHIHLYGRYPFDLASRRPAGFRPLGVLVRNVSRQLCPTQKESDGQARQQISRELGHEREQITAVYLGR